MITRLWLLARKYIEDIMTQPETIKTQLEKRGFVADISPNIFSRTFRQSCPRDSLTNARQVLYVVLRDDGQADFKVVASGKTGVRFEISVTDIPQDKVLHRITEIEGRFADAIAFFQ